MAKQEVKEVVVQHQKAVAIPTGFAMEDDFQDMLPRAESRDMVIPRLTLMQPTSRLEGSPGDILDSETQAKVGGVGQEFQFVPIFFAKDIAISDKESGKWKRNEMKSAANAHWTTFENRVGKDADGKVVERKERLNLFVIKADDLDKPVPSIYRMIIKPSSFKEAKKFITSWDLDIRARQLPFAKVWAVKTKVEMNDQGKFAVYEFAKVMDGKNQKAVTLEQLQAIKGWVKTLVANKEAALAGAEEEVVEDAPVAEATHKF